MNSLQVILSHGIKGQVLPLCNKQSECQIGYYCGDTNLCYTCSYISPGDCDTLNTDCCSKDFLQQCKMNPYKCQLPSNPSQPIDPSIDNTLFLFNLIFFMGLVSYVSVGSYRNKYLHQKKGIQIMPNYEFWKSVMGLVKDGCIFTSSNLCSRNQYGSLE